MEPAVEVDKDVFLITTKATATAKNGFLLSVDDKDVTKCVFWSGPVRIYLSPVMLGKDLVAKIPFDAYTVEWIRVTIADVRIVTRKEQRTSFVPTDLSGPMDLFNEVRLNQGLPDKNKSVHFFNIFGPHPFWKRFAFNIFKKWMCPLFFVHSQWPVSVKYHL